MVLPWLVSGCSFRIAPVVVELKCRTTTAYYKPYEGLYGPRRSRPYFQVQYVQQSIMNLGTEK